MRQFRFIFIAILTSLFVINAVFWQKAIAALLCGVLSFNSTSCYSFLGQAANANSDAAIAALSPSNQGANPEQAGTERKDADKLAICVFGVCVNTPTINIPNILTPNAPAPAPTPSTPNGNSNGQSSVNECEPKDDQCDADGQSKPVDLTGVWLTKGLNATLSQRGCTEGYNGEVFVDSKDNAQGIDVKVTQTGNRLIIPAQVISATNQSEAYTVTTKGRVCGNKIQIVSCGKTSLGKSINRAEGTVIDNGNTVKGESSCKFTGGPATYTSPFTWTRKQADEKELLPEPGDIVIYKGTEGETKGKIIHSGVVTEVRGNAVIQVKSKWGTEGLYFHNPNFENSLYGNDWKVFRAKRPNGSKSNLLKSMRTDCGHSICDIVYYTDKNVRIASVVFDGSHAINQIINWFFLSSSEGKKAVQNYVSNHNDVIPKPDGRSLLGYNCHGFTFTNGNVAVDGYAAVPKIMDDNNYKYIPARDTKGIIH
jgi:hypothetical protein